MVGCDYEHYEFKVGDRVRSYDFAGNFECYVEGTITLVEDYLMTILTDKLCWQGKVEPSTRVVRTHTAILSPWMTRVVKA